MAAALNFGFSGVSSAGVWQLTNEVHFVYDGNLVYQERDQNNNTLTTYTRGNDLSGTLQGAGGIGGLLARSDKMQIIPLILSPLNPDPQWVNTAYYHSDGHWDVNDGQGNRQRYDWRGNPLGPSQAHDPDAPQPPSNNPCP